VAATEGLSVKGLTALEAVPGLLHAELDQVVSIPTPPDVKPAAVKPAAITAAAGIKIPNDPQFPNEWGMVNIHAPYAWSKVTTSPAVVAVIDTGADLTHPDLKADLVPGYNFVANSSNPQDDNGHGTHTAGTIGAVGNNMIGVVGVCWRVKIMPLKFLAKNGSGSLFDAVRAIDYARQKNVQVMSNSWGGGGFSQALADAITRAEKAKILFVAAAGNNGTDNDVIPSYPATYPNGNIISVAAIDINDQKPAFSDYGKKTVHIGAPGVNVWSTYHPNTYQALSGTSMATPHVSGAAALALGHPKYKTYDAAKLKKLLLTNARPISGLSGKCVTNGTLDIRFLDN
jgi:subtilisin family serine protease